MKLMIVLDGKVVSTHILEKLQLNIQETIGLGSRTPRLEIILVGDDFASHKYVQMKTKKAQEIGIRAVVNKFDSSVSEQELIALIEKLNADKRVDGIMVQLPLPNGINEKEVIERIEPLKDVDGLTSTNLGKLFKNDSSAIVPATARGVLELLRHYEIKLEGTRSVIIGRSAIVGLPIAAMLQNENSTITVCHSHTHNLKEICKQADILIVGIGRAEYIDKSYIKEGAVVVDVGTNREENDKLVGDIKFNSVSKVASHITPVPGGVGPMTIASLLLNLFGIYKRNVKRF
jgi:methylenetetrahydrofolate dehydrogenase (NADP+) / methenyltetrahydrofolate cyclohydrolase